MENKAWLINYPDGIKQVEWHTDHVAEVLKRATGNPVVPVIVMTQAEFDNKITEATGIGFSEGYKAGWDEHKLVAEGKIEQ